MQGPEVDALLEVNGGISSLSPRLQISNKYLPQQTTEWKVGGYKFGSFTPSLSPTVSRLSL